MEHLWTPWRSTYVTNKPPAGQCVFCAAIADRDDEKTLLLYRATHNFVILNRYPYSSGHLMIAPNIHVSRLTDISDEAAQEMMRLARASETILEDIYRPQGINLGMNLGEAAGAGIAAHIHLHVLPRWTGDANFMSVVANTRVIPESLADTYTKLRPRFAELQERA
ncbi:MAG TPA: HIT domain-containing protein [Bryobacteraceae bacterium]|nr:HIT domain-containing protein [Bryobacteraceae bacterium]